MGNFIDLTNKKFGLLTVLSRDSEKEKSYKGKTACWKCQCECGNYISVIGGNLRRGVTKSCGCLNRESQAKLGKGNKKFNTYDLESMPYGIGIMSDGEEFYFDKEDYDKIKDICWHLQKGYVVGLQNGEKVVMHRIVMNVGTEYVIDHINHKKYDNRKENLRSCKQWQNAKNRKININNTSGCAGVYYCTRDNKWCSTIKVNYKKISLGRYDSKEDAIKARKQAEPLYFGEYLNRDYQ